MAKTKSLSSRLKKGELYVVYGGIDDFGMHLLSYGDPNRTPRIYGKGAVDSRVSDSLPVCQTLAEATERLKGDAYAVLVPLSAMVRVWGKREVAKWAKVQGHVAPEQVRAYVKQCDPASHAA